jgi:hypothetical protein
VSESHGSPERRWPGYLLLFLVREYIVKFSKRVSCRDTALNHSDKRISFRSLCPLVIQLFLFLSIHSLHNNPQKKPSLFFRCGSILFYFPRVKISLQRPATLLPGLASQLRRLASQLRRLAIQLRRLAMTLRRLAIFLRILAESLQEVARKKDVLVIELQGLAGKNPVRAM